MALFSAVVTKWQTNKTQGWGRVRDTTNGTTYVLNTNRLDSWRASGLTASSCYYFDNPMNSRDSGAYMELTKTPTQLTAYCDTSQHKYITLPIYPSNDATQSTVSRVFAVENIAYAVVSESSSSMSLVTYADFGGKMHTVLVNLTLSALLALL